MVSYGLSFVIAVIFFVVKYALLRTSSNDDKKSKTIVKDTIGVFLSTIIGQFIMEQLEPLSIEIPDVTVSEPNF